MKISKNGPVVSTAVLFAALALAGFQEQQPPAEGYGDDCTRTGCHDTYLKHTTVHDPVDTLSCDGCHEEKEGEKHAFTLAAEGSELCLECHDDPAEGAGFVHGPVAAGACLACHDPHASNHPALLTAESHDLCLTCHATIAKRLSETEFRHDPAEEDCLECHDAHGTDRKFMLVASLPALCVDCHDEIGERMKSAAVKHDALTLGQSCADCHEAHGTNMEHLLSMKPMDLCLSCHGEAVTTKEGERLEGMAALLKENPDHHGPIREKDCTACHAEIHGGPHFRLLKEAYPPEFYAPFAEQRYALCFECHDPDLVQVERSDKITGFRNGDLNLHFLHVHKKKGRTCRACHETHASKNPFHIRESVPFGEGGWKLPIRYERTEHGGSCLCGCHRRYRYDREKPASNKRPEKKGRP